MRMMPGILPQLQCCLRCGETRLSAVQTLALSWQEELVSPLVSMTLAAQRLDARCFLFPTTPAVGPSLLCSSSPSQHVVEVRTVRSAAAARTLQRADMMFRAARLQQCSGVQSIKLPPHGIYLAAALPTCFFVPREQQRRRHRPSWRRGLSPLRSAMKAAAAHTHTPLARGCRTGSGCNGAGQ
jgi:hypothetical protein